MKKEELYEAIVKLCQEYGVTTGRSYDLIHELIDSLADAEEETDGR